MAEYNVLEVAQHVINYSIKNSNPVTNLKLQKILYYIQAAFLVEYNEECFDEEIKHWRHGPVIPKVYSEFKNYIDKDINDFQSDCLDMYIDSNANLSVKKIIYNENHFYIEDIELINNIIDSYKDVSPWDMVKKTHQEDPWINTTTNETIKSEDIKDYFIINKNRIYGGISEQDITCN